MAQTAPQPVIELRGARLGDEGRVVVDEVELEVARGDFLAVIGPARAGKSLLLRAAVGLSPPLVGVCSTRGRAGYVAQGAARDLPRDLTVREVVTLGLLDVGAGDTGAATRRALQSCGLAEAASIPAGDLDAAERTRVAIARALAGDPVVLALDDPTRGLDEEGAQEITDLLQRLHAGGLTVVVAARAVEPLARAARRVAFIRGGRLVAGPAADMLVPERLGALYEAPAGGDDDDADDADDAEVPIPPRDASPEERRAAARARREAARARLEASRSGRVERAAAPAAAPPPPGPPRWLWPLVILILLATTVRLTLGARTERRAHEATIAALDSERAGRLADARAAQERELDALEEAALLRGDLDATRLDREAIAAARDEAAARAETLERQLAAAEANRAALSAELQRTGAELAAARLETSDRAAALDDARRSLALVEQEKAGLARALDEAAAAVTSFTQQRAALEAQRDEARALTKRLEAERDEARARATHVEAERDEARARAAGAEAERDAARARTAAAEGERDDARARLAVADEALARARPTRAVLSADAAQVTSSMHMVVRVTDGRVLGSAVQAALDGGAVVSLGLRLSDPGAAGRLRLRAEVQGEPTSELARSVAGLDAAAGEHVRFWLDRAAAARCARGFARDGFTLVLALEPDPARPDEVVQVQAVEVVVAPLPAEAAPRLRALDRGED